MKTVEVTYIPSMRKVTGEKGTYLKILHYNRKTIFKYAFLILNLDVYLKFARCV